MKIVDCVEEPTWKDDKPLVISSTAGSRQCCFLFFLSRKTTQFFSLSRWNRRNISASSEKNQFLPSLSLFLSFLSFLKKKTPSKWFITARTLCTIRRRREQFFFRGVGHLGCPAWWEQDPDAWRHFQEEGKPSDRHWPTSFFIFYSVFISRATLLHKSSFKDSPHLKNTWLINFIGFFKKFVPYRKTTIYQRTFEIIQNSDVKFKKKIEWLTFSLRTWIETKSLCTLLSSHDFKRRRNFSCKLLTCNSWQLETPLSLFSLRVWKKNKRIDTDRPKHHLNKSFPWLQTRKKQKGSSWHKLYFTGQENNSLSNFNDMDWI